MSETLTVDPTPTAEVAGEAEGVQLTADEQDSLAVGESITQQQDQLLAGKYKNAEELERAYGELEAKLGQREAKDTPENPDESDEIEAEKPSISPAGELITSASEEYAKSGELTAETLAKFNEMSSSDLVKAYMEVQAANPDTDTADTGEDISTATVNEVKNYAGGEQAYQQIVDWASSNLDQDSIDAFDSIVGSGSVEAIKLAVNGLKAQYETANGYEGKMYTGKSPTNTKDVYRSQAELVAAMSDKRYDNDPAYRQDVIEKLERSDNLQF